MTPAFFVYMPTLMMDIPMLAFLLAGFAIYFEYVEGRRGALVSRRSVLSWPWERDTPPLCLSDVFSSPCSSDDAHGKSWQASPRRLALAVWLAAMTVHFGFFPLSKTVSYFAGQGSITNDAWQRDIYRRRDRVPLDCSRKRVSPIVMFLTLAAMYAPWPARVYPIWTAVLLRRTRCPGHVCSCFQEARRFGSK